TSPPQLWARHFWRAPKVRASAWRTFFMPRSGKSANTACCFAPMVGEGNDGGHTDRSLAAGRLGTGGAGRRTARCARRQRVGGGGSHSGTAPDRKDRSQCGGGGTDGDRRVVRKDCSRDPAAGESNGLRRNGTVCPASF